MSQIPGRYSIDELALLTGLTKRTIRYYIQIGLVERPEGVRRGAFYTDRHLEQLINASGLRQAGLTLDGVRRQLAATPVLPARPVGAGVEVWSRITVRDGIELNIEPHRAGLRPEQVRELCHTIVRAVEALAAENEGGLMVADRPSDSKGE